MRFFKGSKKCKSMIPKPESKGKKSGIHKTNRKASRLARAIVGSKSPAKLALHLALYFRQLKNAAMHEAGMRDKIMVNSQKDTFNRIERRLARDPEYRKKIEHHFRSLNEPDLA